jgi:ABC-2 type transport system ATP-binding protein
LATNVQGDEIIHVSAMGSSDAVRSRLTAVEGVQAVGVIGEGLSGETRFEVHAERGREVRPALAAAVSAAGGELTELHQEQITLEDIFVRIIGGERKDGDDS